MAVSGLFFAAAMEPKQILEIELLSSPMVEREVYGDLTFSSPMVEGEVYGDLNPFFTYGSGGSLWRSNSFLHLWLRGKCMEI